MTFPAPIDIGAPAQYLTWRDHQPDAISAIVDSPHRFVGSVLPTGAGKTLTVVGAALLAGWRTVCLTSTKLLQEQYLRDMADAGMVDVRGANNYECLAFHDEHRSLRDKAWHGCDDGPCKAGLVCSRKPLPDEPDVEKGCLRYDAIARARRSQLVVTNYKMWLNANRHRRTLGTFDCLVLDEAHHAPTELADFLSTTLQPADLQLLGSGGPRDPQDAPQWAEWAKAQAKVVEGALESRPKNRMELRRHRQLNRLAQKLATLQTMKGGQWVIQQHHHAWHFDPVWVADYSHVLFRHAPKVVFTSATFTRKTAAMLGVGADDMTWHEAPSDFPVERRPVYYIPCVKLDYKADESQIRLWLATIDNVLRTRRDRKGIIHAVSYERARLIKRYSAYSDDMLIHETATTRDTVARFKDAGPGAILVSPSVTTGYDFPMDQCRYQIVVKIPFPDRRDPVVQARTSVDKDYPGYIAMQEIVQAVGRGMRSAEDACETFIVDDNARWFFRAYRSFAPSWFLDAYQPCTTIPDPLVTCS